MAAKHALFGLTKDYFIAAIPLTIGALFGKFLDDKETERMSLFRDRSALYGGMVKPGEKPSWP